ncbi:MAG: aminotransferase class III-fold pyridoxal phosphate-dependent enzyme, partial [Chitinophagales bacterium]|nr:aminotransferase class III-fold pyridoxal phosphate-dependent enzyme [Chitinophagales bacterium]
GKAAMEVVLNEGLVNGISYRQNLFRQQLQHVSIKEFRSIGLLMALEFEDEVFCKKVVSSCIHSGVVTDWFLFAPQCMRLAPPLTISEEEIGQACESIIRAIREVSGIN